MSNFFISNEIRKKETGWFLIKRKNTPILFNKSFYLAYKTIHGGNIDEFEDEFDSIKDILRIYPNIFKATKKILNLFFNFSILIFSSKISAILFGLITPNRHSLPLQV